MIQSEEFLRRLLCPLLKTGLPLRKNAIKPLPKSVLIPFELTAAAHAGKSWDQVIALRLPLRIIIIQY